ncbi:MAG: hypothetical protein KC656_24490, partial [Myxococcales bacterium]|nr:hypothetical protein [Myxococcales bacterium]
MPDASAADAPIDRRILPVAVVLVTWAGILAAASRYAWAFYSDDAFISLRYSARLLQGRGLTWTDGERVEGYSNLLWVLGCAALGALGVDIVPAPRILAAAGVLALLFAIARGDDGPDPHRALSGGLFVAATGGIGVWIMGGLSQAVVASLGTLFLVAVRRGSTPPWLLGGLAAALTLLRIDGFVWLIALTVGAVAAGRLGRRALGVVGACAALAVGGQQVFRLVYYGDWVPNTARVKVSFTPARAFRGADWVADALADNLVLVGVAVVAVALLRRRDILDAPI